MKKFFKMKNLVKKIILILRNFFGKIVEKKKKKFFSETFKIVQNSQI